MNDSYIGSLPGMVKGASGESGDLLELLGLKDECQPVDGSLTGGYASPPLAVLRIGEENYDLHKALGALGNRLGGACISAEASGAVCNITDAVPAKALSAVTTIAALSGSGDPSPDNVRPAIARDTVSLWHEAEYNAKAPAKLTAALPETVHGGSIDWKTGELTVMYVAQSLTGNEAWKAAGGGVAFSLDNRAVQNVRIMLDNNRSYHLCSHYKPVAYKSPADQADMTSYTVNSYQLLIKDTSCGEENDTADVRLANFKAYLSAQAAAGTPVTLLWQLKPEYRRTIRIAPQQLEMLKGANAVWSDAGDTTLTYIADTKMYIDNALARVENAILSMGANI